MKEITDIRELQKIEFDILCDIDRFCRENDIHYFLAAGTLLGAIRHKGFIPWDDDIDIGMLRPDYEKFIAKYKSDKNELWWYGNTPKYFFPYAKVVAKGTLLTGGDFPYLGCGVFVDILPYDEIEDSQSKWKRAINRWAIINQILTLRNIRLFRKGRSLLKQFVVFLRAPLRLIPNRWFLSWLDRKIVRGKMDGPHKIAHLVSGAMYGLREIHNSDIFNDFITVSFEGKSFFAPKGWHDFLKDLYGDYMKLPPAEKQKAHHDFRAWVCTNETDFNARS